MNHPHRVVGVLVYVLEYRVVAVAECYVGDCCVLLPRPEACPLTPWATTGRNLVEFMLGSLCMKIQPTNT